MASTFADPEATARQTRASIRYLGQGDYVTRRYVSQGAEMNTGDYFDYDMTVRDGRPIRDHFGFDVHGFMIAREPSVIADFHDKAAVDAVYLAECEAAIARLTGASKVAAQGWMIRTTGDLSARAQQKVAGYKHSGGIQPQASEAHIDHNPQTGERVGARVYADRFAGGPGYRRHVCVSFWRTFSPPPQDWPLAVMDGRSIVGDEMASNTLFVVDAFPEGDALTAPVAGEDQMIAASILRHRDAHRWWYFSGMDKGDALLFKFYDSDHSVTWRCPHTAFHDGTMPGTHVRESIEVRAIAFFE